MLFHPTSWKSILILSFHLRLGLLGGLFPSGLPNKTLYAPLCYMPRWSDSSRFDNLSSVLLEVRIIKFLVM
jgi:hypothetical protein